MEYVEGERTGSAQMGAHRVEACELVVERQVVEERAERNHHERKLLIEFEPTHVGLDDDDPISLCLRQLSTLVSKPSEHAIVRIERVNGRALPGDRQREAPGSGPQLQNRPAGLTSLARIPLGITSKRRRRREIVEIGVGRRRHDHILTVFPGMHDPESAIRSQKHQ